MTPPRKEQRPTRTNNSGEDSMDPLSVLLLPTLLLWLARHDDRFSF